MNKAWDHDPDSEESGDESDTPVYTADDLEEGEEGATKKRNMGGRGGRDGRGQGGDSSVVPKGEYYKKPKKS